MDRHLGTHRVPQRGLLPVPARPACSPPTPGWWNWGSGHAEAFSSAHNGPVLQESLEAVQQPQERRGQQQGGRDGVGLLGLPVELVFLHLLLSRP